MYIHIGGDTVISTNDIIGIFDLDNSTVSYKTRDFLSRAQKEGKIINTSLELPKSFIICRNKDDYIVYICQLSSGTVMKRTGRVETDKGNNSNLTHKIL